MTRRLVVAAVVVALVAAVAAVAAGMLLTRQRIAPVSDRLWPAGSLTVVVLPEAEARALAPGAPAALGVLPRSHRSLEFIREISSGAPRSLEGVRSPLRGRLGALGDALGEAHVSVEIAAMPDVSPDVVRALGVAFSPSVAAAGPARARLVAVAAATADQVRDPDLAPFAEASSGSAVLVVGLPTGGGTPVRVVATNAGGSAANGSGVLGQGLSRRPAIATPYDLAATILDHFGIARSDRFVGRPLRVVPGQPDAVDALRARLVRDRNVRTSLTAYTAGWIIGLGVIAVIFAVIFAAAGGRPAARRLATCVSVATFAYLAGLFIPSPRGDVRALVVAGAVLAGVAVRPRRPERFAAAVFLGLAAATAVLGVWASLRPGAEPALSLWGNPLESWRFYGLANHEAGFVIAGLVAAGAVFQARAPTLIVSGVAAGFLLGAPFLGANFVGVLLLGFGITLVALSSRARAFRLRHAVVAAIVGAGAFLVALLADSSGSHGGQAVERIGSGGWGAAGDYVRDRLSLNLESIRTFFGGPLFMPLIVAAILTMGIWALRSRREWSGTRVAIVAGAAVALAAMAVEDSGFLMGTGLAFPVMVLWILWAFDDAPPRAARERTPRT